MLPYGYFLYCCTRVLEAPFASDSVASICRGSESRINLDDEYQGQFAVNNMKPTLVVFALDDQRYALHLASVERVVRAVEITPLPKAPEMVTGVLNVRGSVIPVFNMRRRFRLAERAIRLSDQIIIAHAGRRRVALVVDAVLDVADCQEKAFLAPEEILPDLEYVTGAVKLSDGLVFIHDLATFLSLDEEAALNEALSQSAPTNA